jgi:serine/threonine protein kinase
MDRGRPLYLVYEYMDEGDLWHALQNEPSLTERERVKVGATLGQFPVWHARRRGTSVPCVCVSWQILVDVCAGLAFCHNGCDGVIPGVLLHRDLKPENILLCRDRVTEEVIAALGDFGISKLLPSDTGDSHSRATTGVVVGTKG